MATEQLNTVYAGDEGEEEEPLDEEALASIGRGLADAEPGQTLSVDEARAYTDATLEERANPPLS